MVPWIFGPQEDQYLVAFIAALIPGMIGLIMVMEGVYGRREYLKPGLGVLALAVALGMFGMYIFIPICAAMGVFIIGTIARAIYLALTE
jgi:hypothetical protein